MEGGGAEARRLVPLRGRLVECATPGPSRLQPEQGSELRRLTWGALLLGSVAALRTLAGPASDGRRRKGLVCFCARHDPTVRVGLGWLKAAD